MDEPFVTMSTFYLYSFTCEWTVVGRALLVYIIYRASMYLHMLLIIAVMEYDMVRMAAKCPSAQLKCGLLKCRGSEQHGHNTE